MSVGVVRVAERRGRVMTVLPCVCLEGGPMYMMAGEGGDLLCDFCQRINARPSPGSWIARELE